MKSFFLFLLLTTSLFGSAKKVVFIVNPIAHELKGLDVRRAIENHLDPTQFEYQIVYTKAPGHATELAYNALLNSADIVAAVGGDGTVNEVGRALVNTKASLAIIPMGSGNGLARHLGIPVGLIPAIALLNKANPISMDTAKINEKVFLSVAGIGFDAHVAHSFAGFGKRGFGSYLQVAFKEFSNYEPEAYRIIVDGKEIVRKGFIITFANSSQYGNNFIISPKAEVSDGYLDLNIIDEIPILSIPQFVYRFKHGTLDQSRHFETHRFKELVIQRGVEAHVDGEPIKFEDEIKVTVQPHSLTVLVPKSRG